MNTNSYLPGQGLLNIISEYIAEAPSPAPIPSKPVIIAEPVNSRNLWDENEKLKDEVKSLKQEVKVLKNVCGLDRRLKITKIEEEDLHKYYQYDLKRLYWNSSHMQTHGQDRDKDIVILNKTTFDLEFSRKNLKNYNSKHCHGYRSGELKGNNIIPCNGVMFNSVYEEGEYGYNPAGGGGEKLVTYSYGEIIWDQREQMLVGLKEDVVNFMGKWKGQHDINEWFILNITFPKLPDFMKIENMNTIDIDIYKMKGIYIITYE